ncbi:MAG: radical SAM protein [Lachnospiraceae bacterium]|nr:radical SAM protein [Lachnospiraceae bacterium]
MEEKFDIQSYLAKGVEQIVSDALRATMKNPRESAYMLRFSAASRKASRKRAKTEAAGEHVPAFLIASITSSCNLHCSGCYSRCSEATSDKAPVDQLSGEEWKKVFKEADDMGVSFILLAGGEPLLRWDVIEEAAKRPNMIFPVFTNGTFLGEKYLELFDEHRNLIPVISIEGDRDETDSRRGEGVYDKLISAMSGLQERDILFGVSVTVTSENVRKVTSDDFLSSLSEKGCKLVIYVEYVPVTKDSRDLALSDEERAYLADGAVRARENFGEMIFVSFPGDEKGSGGCIAAGRGFFHINSRGGAEPCPFSPYSDVNVRDTSLREAIRSKLFALLRDKDILADDHVGGCVLFEKRELVEEQLAKGFPLA